MSVAATVSRCAALGDPTRWQVLELVGTQPRSASALAHELPVSRQAITRHLELLEAAGLVERRRVGAEVRYAALGHELTQLARTLESVGRGWERRLAALKDEAERAPG